MPATIVNFIYFFMFHFIPHILNNELNSNLENKAPRTLDVKKVSGLKSDTEYTTNAYGFVVLNSWVAGSTVVMTFSGSDAFSISCENDTKYIPIWLGVKFKVVVSGASAHAFFVQFG